ncbi:MAG: glycosyltransferase family 2 protein [Candidatus Margulisiibacteriota bacterium]
MNIRKACLLPSLAGFYSRWDLKLGTYNRSKLALLQGLDYLATPFTPAGHKLLQSRYAIIGAQRIETMGEVLCSTNLAEPVIDNLKYRLSYLLPTDFHGLDAFEEDLKWYLTMGNHLGKPLSAQPKVSFVILHYGKDFSETEALLKSMVYLRYRNFDLVLVDNNSPDRFFDKGIDFSRFPGLEGKIRFVHSPKNLGFTGGNNLGARYALRGGAELVCYLNNDALVEAGLLDDLVGKLQRYPRIGVIAPNLNYDLAVRADRLESRQGQGNVYLDPQKGWVRDSSWKASEFVLRRKWESAEQVKEGPEGLYYKSFALVGTAFMIRADVLRLTGGFDPRTFHYLEEHDFCIRARRTGYELALSMRSNIFHPRNLFDFKNQSFHFWYLNSRNFFYFFPKHYRSEVKGVDLPGLVERGFGFACPVRPERIFNYLDAFLKEKEWMKFIALYKGVYDGARMNFTSVSDLEYLNEAGLMASYRLQFERIGDLDTIFSLLLAEKDHHLSRLMLWALGKVEVAKLEVRAFEQKASHYSVDLASIVAQWRQDYGFGAE